MKKIVLSLLLIAACSIALSQTAFAQDGETGTLVIHFARWNEDYENIGTHSWGGIDPRFTPDGTDDFGVYWTYEDVSVVDANSTETFGFIAVERPNGLDSDPNWDNKYTDDVFIPRTVIQADETVHVYVIEGAASSSSNPGYFVASQEHYNLLLIYFDPSGAYEENLGVHAWGGWTLGQETWGDPFNVFTKAGATETGSEVKGSILQSTEIDAGLLIYAGSNDNKKTGDVNLDESLGETPALGDVGFAFVVSRGDGYEGVDNVFYTGQLAEFVEEAFTFSLLPYGIDAAGFATGTYAVDPTTVIVKTSATIANPGTNEAAMDLIKSWFTIIEEDSENEIAIGRVDYAQTNTSLSDFVIILDEALDNTKAYTLYFNDSTDEQVGNEASLVLALDRQAPEISFLGSNLINKPAEERIIVIPWGQLFDMNLFPLFLADDDRDGDLTVSVYVPSGEYSVLDTRTVGDYTIMLEVSDTWGNVTQETFIFRVERR